MNKMVKNSVTMYMKWAGKFSQTTVYYAQTHHHANASSYTVWIVSCYFSVTDT